eukprot:1223447-Amphidinium_carterae.1
MHLWGTKRAWHCGSDLICKLLSKMACSMATSGGHHGGHSNCRTLPPYREATGEELKGLCWLT